MIKGLIAGLILALMTASASAWDDQGHMMVAAIAYDQLSPSTKTRVAQLLALSGYPTNGLNNASADAIKKDGTNFVNDGQDPTKAPDAAANRGFIDRNMHRYWHYIDLPFSPDETPLVQPHEVNAQERIALFRNTLASDAPDPLKAYDLVWLLHLVADVHQPLHATSRFTNGAPKGDRGGNAVKLCASPCRDDLHAFWDQAAGRKQTVSAAIHTARALPQPDQAQADQRDEAVWIRESFEIAQQVVYAAPLGVAPGPFTLDDTYKANARRVAMERVALAGARLANLLNNELK